MRFGLVDRVRIMVFPLIHGTEGEEPAFAELGALDLTLINATVIDDRLVFLDYRVGNASSVSPAWSPDRSGMEKRGSRGRN